jgi:hypothetical protein
VSTKGELGAVVRWGERAYKGASDKVRASTSRGWQWRSRALLPYVDRIHTVTEHKFELLCGMVDVCYSFALIYLLVFQFVSYSPFI